MTDDEIRDVLARTTPWVHLSDVRGAVHAALSDAVERFGHWRAVARRAEARVAALEAAIREHRSQKADDRCVEDDDRLYAALGDGVPCDRRVGDKAAMLRNCERFIRNRCEGGGWPTYAELEAERDRLAIEVAGANKAVAILNAGLGRVCEGRDELKHRVRELEARVAALKAAIRRARDHYWNNGESAGEDAATAFQILAEAMGEIARCSNCGGDGCGPCHGIGWVELATNTPEGPPILKPVITSTGGANTASDAGISTPAGPSGTTTEPERSP